MAAKVVVLLVAILASTNSQQQTATYQCVAGSTPETFGIEFTINRGSDTVNELVYYTANDGLFLISEEQSAAECSTPVIQNQQTFTLTDIDPNNLPCGAVRDTQQNTCNWAIRSKGDINTDKIFTFSCCEQSVGNILRASIVALPLPVIKEYVRGTRLIMDLLDIESSFPPVYRPVRIADIGDSLQIRIAFHKGFRLSGRDNLGTSFTVGFPSDLNPSNLKLTFCTPGLGTFITVSYLDQGNFMQRDLLLEYNTCEEVTIPGRLAANPSTSTWALENKAVRVDSQYPIGLIVSSCTGLTCGSYIALPDDILGTSYLVLMSPFQPEQEVAGSMSRSQALIIANEITTVNIQLPQDFVGQVTFDDGTLIPPTLSASNPLTVTMNPFNTLHLYSPNDLTGTMVTASAPVAVIGGNEDGFSGSDAVVGSEDRTLLQYPPLVTASRTYVFVRLPTSLSDDVTYEVQKSVPLGVASIVSQLDTDSLTLPVTSYTISNAGADGGYEVRFTQESFLVGQTILSDVNGRPSMLMLPSVEQWAYKCNFLLQPGRVSTILVVKEKGVLVSMDGVDITQGITPRDILPVTNGDLIRYESVAIVTTVVVPEYREVRVSLGSEQSSIMCLVYEQVDGRISATNTFNLGYPESNPCVLRTQDTSHFGDRRDNDCDGQTDEERHNGIDDDGDGQTDEDVAISNPDEPADVKAIFVQTLEIANNADFLNDGRNVAITVIENACNLYSDIPGAALATIGNFQRVDLGPEFSEYFVISSDIFWAFGFSTADNFVYFRALVDLSTDEDVIDTIVCPPPPGRRRRSTSGKEFTVVSVLEISKGTSRGNSTAQGRVTYIECQSDLGYWTFTVSLIVLVLVEGFLLTVIALLKRRTQKS